MQGERSAAEATHGSAAAGAPTSTRVTTYICLFQFVLLVDLEQGEARRSLEKQQHTAAAVLGVLRDDDQS
jgi:hypothetical protein